MISKPVKPFVKVNFEDIEVARKFFNNESHLADFILNVCNFYMGKSVVTRYKVVSRYLATYEQVMSRVIEAKEFGKMGGYQKAENQKNTTPTLEGGIEATPLPNTKLQLLNTKYNKYITLLNLRTGKNYKGGKKDLASFGARILEGYTIEDFERSVENATKDKFHISENFKHLTPEFLTRQDKLDKFCQEVVVPKHVTKTCF